MADGPAGRILPRTLDRVRADLTDGLAAAVAEKGYPASTIADIVRHARVSKRTFYEHFADKQECLMALYADGCAHLMRTLREAGDPGQPWRDRVAVVVAAYLSALDAMPAVNRTLLVEIQAAGPRAYRLRQATQRRFAETLAAIVAESRPANPDLPELSPAAAIALVGGLNELLLQVIDPYAGTGIGVPGTDPFTSLHDTIVRLVSGVLTYRS